ncbi:MAG: FHA domain-containing protein [Chromatiaceae bacterium]|nr:FHA domain-containing protein [Chromatiaceae bacterium]
MSGPRHKFSIGRERSCAIPVADDSVSAMHAELTFLGDGKLLLTDCNSTNGTR